MMIKSTEDAAVWAEQHGGERALKDAIESGTFGHDRQANAYAKLWLLQQEDARRNSVYLEERQLREREVMASEAAAESARKAAVAAAEAMEMAKKSQRWALLAVLVALLALAAAIIK